MYKQSAGWSEWYRETEPGKRREMLNSLMEKEPDDGANEYRSRLFELRHGSGEETEKDLFLWQCVNFSQIYESSVFLKGLSRKEVRNALRQMGCEEAKQYREAGEGALYWEIRNAARRYFGTCRGSDYRRVLFGLMNSSEKDKTRNMCKDAWQMSVGVSERLGLEEEMRVWIQAVTDEYAMTDPKGLERLKEYHVKETAGKR